MQDLIHDSALWHIIRFATGKKVFLYPEERADFIFPASFREGPSISGAATLTPTLSTPHEDPTIVPCQSDLATSNERYVESQHESRGIGNLEPAGEDAHAIRPTVTKNGDILVTWYTTNDPENPQNWTSRKKLWVTILISYAPQIVILGMPCQLSYSLYSFAVYFGSSIFSPGVPEMVKQVGVSELVGSLGLSLYVLACMFPFINDDQIWRLLILLRWHWPYDILPP